jgi:hypothetical protein
MLQAMLMAPACFVKAASGPIDRWQSSCCASSQF